MLNANRVQTYLKHLVVQDSFYKLTLNDQWVHIDILQLSSTKSDMYVLKIVPLFLIKCKHRNSFHIRRFTSKPPVNKQEDVQACFASIFTSLVT